MFKNAKTFDIKLANIPLLGLREEFETFQRLLSSEAFHDHFVWSSGPIETPYFTWLGHRDAFLSFVLRQSILGIEAYVPHAVLNELGSHHRLSEEIVEKLQAPFSLGGRGAADNYYNRVPALIEPRWSLRSCEPKLWETTKQFYVEVRNPLFHGYNVEAESHHQVLQALGHIKSLYAWVDRWHNIENFLPGVKDVFPESFGAGDEA